MVTIPLPSAADLVGIFWVHLAGDLAGVDLRPIAELAVGATGAQVAAWVAAARQRASTLRRPMEAARFRRRRGAAGSAAERFFQDHRLQGCPKFWVPPNSEHRSRFFTRSECARLLGAALGFVWDADTGDWKRELVKVDGRTVRRLVRLPKSSATNRLLARDRREVMPQETLVNATKSRAIEHSSVEID